MVDIKVYVFVCWNYCGYFVWRKYMFCLGQLLMLILLPRQGCSCADSHVHTLGSRDNLDIFNVLVFFLHCHLFLFSKILYCAVFSCVLLYLHAFHCLKLINFLGINTNCGSVLKVLIERWPKMCGFNGLSAVFGDVPICVISVFQNAWK